MSYPTKRPPCNPQPIELFVLSEDEEFVFVDDNDVAILVGKGRTGSRFEFEFNLYEAPTP